MNAATQSAVHERFSSPFAQDNARTGGPAAVHLPTGVVLSPIYRTHNTGLGHPESHFRYDAIVKALRAGEFEKRIVKLKPRRAEDSDILLCHTRTYLEIARRDIASGASQLSTGDTPVCAESFEAAMYAAGGLLTAVDAVMASQIRNAFCVVRPPGHHATRSRGMGFCVFNNIALAARYAQQRYEIDKVLIADWDVHHGNGTQDIFYEDGSVFYFSTHLMHWYPGTGSEEETGAGPGEGTTLNCPFEARVPAEEIIAAFEDKLVPAADAFRPDLVLISAGFDSRMDDPLGRFTLTDEDFAKLTTIVMEIAQVHARGRVVSALEGGYELSGLASASAAHVRALCGA